MPQRAQVGMEMFNVEGRQVAVRPAQWWEQGEHVIDIAPAGGVGRGIYWVRAKVVEADATYEAKARVIVAR